MQALPSVAQIRETLSLEDRWLVDVSGGGNVAVTDAESDLGFMLTREEFADGVWESHGRKLAQELRARNPRLA